MKSSVNSNLLIVCICILSIITLSTSTRFFSPIPFSESQTPPAAEVSCKDPYVPVPIFLGDVSAKYDKSSDELTPKEFNLLNVSHNVGNFTTLGGGNGHGHGGGSRDPNADYRDTTKWSTYPQKSQNAHVAVGVLTCFTLYIWFCNVNGFLQLSKAFMLTGLVQVCQGVYLSSWVLYLLHPQDLKALWEYSLKDVMELQHLAIASCLIVTGIWDFITGWILHFQIPIYIDSYSRQIQRSVNGEKIKQPNNLLFWQRYVPIIITIAHMLNGANFIKHPQHSDENTTGHVLLGLSMMLGGFCFYWVRVRHKVWRHLTQEIYPSLSGEYHMSLSTTTVRPKGINGSKSNHSTLEDLSRSDDGIAPGSNNNNNNNNRINNTSNDITSIDMNDNQEVWNVGARYSIEDLQTLGALQTKRSTMGKGSFDIFAFDTTPPPVLPKSNLNNEDDDLDNIDSSPMVSSEDQYRSAAQSRYEWNGSVLDVEYRKHLYPHLNEKFRWNSVSTSKIVNYLHNSQRYVFHHIWYTKTLRELITFFFACVSTFNFMFIAWLLMTFIEPPEALHFQHYYNCFTELNFVYITFSINIILSGLALIYLFATYLHYRGALYFPALYKIKFLQK